MVLHEKISESTYLSIKKFFYTNKNEEMCGVIVDAIHGGRFVECENIALDRVYYFQINPCVFIDNKVDFVVHSHCMGSAKPSGLDIKCSESMDIPFLIYSILNDDFCLYQNKSVCNFKV
jgi:proteasome lid subunit RPN8/RPN11